METQTYYSSWVGTFSGRRINLDDIKPEDIDIVDIALGLANQCRYSGQVWPYYSVAEHSVAVSNLVYSAPGSDIRLKALLHDAPEFIINDLVRPVKRLIQGYDDIEKRIMDAVSEKFNLEYSDRDWDNIKFFDGLITIPERRQLMPFLDHDSYGRGVHLEDIPNIFFKCFPPGRAALAFLNQFSHLTGWTPDEKQSEVLGYLEKGFGDV